MLTYRMLLISMNDFDILATRTTVQKKSSPRESLTCVAWSFMKGIILAAGAGSRLYPASSAISKILLPVYDKPMIYYPLCTLMLANIRDIMIITTRRDQKNFIEVLGDGSSFGINISYAVQESPKGIVDAFLIAEDFIGNDNCCLTLGDNIFHGMNFIHLLHRASLRKVGATVFGYLVRDPSRFGVVEFDKCGKVLSIEEKPEHPKSDYAVTGLYFYDGNVCDYARQVIPSARGELEITDLNKIYLARGELNVEILGRGFAWLDTGTFDSLLQASNFVQSMELNTGVKIACLEELAYNNGFLTSEQIEKSIRDKKMNGYYEYVRNVISKPSVSLDEKLQRGETRTRGEEIRDKK